MTAKEFIIDRYGYRKLRELWHAKDVVEVIEAYHAHETKQQKKELLSIGSYEQELMKKEYERGVEDGKTIAEHGTTNWIE